MNLEEILKDVPRGINLYSTIHGSVKFNSIRYDTPDYPILCLDEKGNGCSLTKEGKNYTEYDGECVLFPSKENRDWSTFVTDLKPLTPCLCFNGNGRYDVPIYLRWYNSKGTVFVDAKKEGRFVNFEFIIPTDKYNFETNTFEPKYNYGKTSGKKW